MEPKLPAPHLGPERSPVSYGRTPEHTPASFGVENTIEQRNERVEQRVESSPMSTAQALPLSTAMPVLTPPTTVSSDNSSSKVAVDAPLVASDDDLIEREWVDKAKKIIVQTKDDPYMREQEVGKLQADYLRKRYGRELGAPQ
jgi:hypothetical protein